VAECIEAGHQADEDPIMVVHWPREGKSQKWVEVRPPPEDFDFSHMQYLACGYGKDCKYGVTCTRAHSSPAAAEIAYWNWLQPLTHNGRKRRPSGLSADDADKADADKA
jgi:hypothetical protein